MGSIVDITEFNDAKLLLDKNVIKDFSLMMDEDDYKRIEAALISFADNLKMTG